MGHSVTEKKSCIAVRLIAVALFSALVSACESDGSAVAGPEYKLIVDGRSISAGGLCDFPDMIPDCSRHDAATPPAPFADFDAMISAFATAAQVSSVSRSQLAGNGSASAGGGSINSGRSSFAVTFDVDSSGPAYLFGTLSAAGGQSTVELTRDGASVVSLDSRTGMGAFDLEVMLEPGRLFELAAEAVTGTGFPQNASWQLTFTNQQP